MKGQTNHNIVDNHLQRHLRKNPTAAESALWRRLRAGQIEGLKFRRQHPFLDYVLDFACIERRLVVEVIRGALLESCPHPHPVPPLEGEGALLPPQGEGRDGGGEAKPC